MKKQIQIRIFQDGTIRSETFHIKGKECLSYIKVVEELLEARTVDSDFTSEYYESAEKQTISETEETRLEEEHV